jgi:hypothetical protein
VALLGVRADELTDAWSRRTSCFGRATRAVLEARRPRAQALLEAALLALGFRASRRTPTPLARLAAARIERARAVRIAGWRAAPGSATPARARVSRAVWRFAEDVCAHRALPRPGALERGGRPVEIALAQGYFDQPHLVRDFVAFACDSPRRIFRPGRGPPASAA